MLVKKYTQYINEDLNSSSHYIPTYEECRQICDANDNFLFYESKHKVDGYDISIFNYRLAQPQDFEFEILEISENGKSLRINGNSVFNGRKISEYSDVELSKIGFRELSKFKI